MKTCTICKQTKPLDAFYGNKFTQDHCGSQCKQCDTIERRKRRNEKKQVLVNTLGGRCQRCGYDKCLAALEFHHVDKDKDMDMNKIINRST